MVLFETTAAKIKRGNLKFLNLLMSSWQLNIYHLGCAGLVVQVMLVGMGFIE